MNDGSVLLDLGEDGVHVCPQWIAIMKRASGELLGDDEVAAQHQYGRTEKDIELCVQLAAYIPQHQYAARSAEHRAKSKEYLAELEVSTPQGIDVIEDEINILRSQQDSLRKELEYARAEVEKQQSAIHSLVRAIDNGVYPAIAERIKARSTGIRSVRVSLAKKRNDANLLGRFCETAFQRKYTTSQKEGVPGFLNSVWYWMKEHGVGDLNASQYCFYNEVTEEGGVSVVVNLTQIEEAKALLRPIVEKLKAEIVPLSAMVEKADAEIEQLRHYLVPN